MKGFKMFFYDNSNNPILISQYNINSPSTTLTFNEQITENENDQFDLTFSFSSVLAQNSRFPSQVKLIDFLRIGRKLRLEFENHWDTNYVDFIIVSISPEGKESNIVYNVSAKDYFSYTISKTGVGLILNTFEDEDWLAQGLEPNIFTIGNYILRRTYLQNITVDKNVLGWKTNYYTAKVATTWTIFLPVGKNYLDPNNFVYSLGELQTVNNFVVRHNTYYTISFPRELYDPQFSWTIYQYNYNNIVSTLSLDNSDLFVYSSEPYYGKFTFLTPANVNYLSITIQDNNDYLATNGIGLIILEKGETFTGYASYIPRDLSVIDSIVLINGDAVLVKNEFNIEQNGLYRFNDTEVWQKNSDKCWIR